MKTRFLGDLEVSALGYGCMGLSHAYGAAVEESEAIKTVRAAYDAGYTFFDTAECYTGNYADGSVSNNEEIVGKALKNIRDKVVIATKFGVKHGGSNLILDSSPDTVRKAVDGSLKRLGVDHIDLYYQHRIDPKVEPETVAEVMNELIKSGKIRFWGISEATEDYLCRANKICRVTAIQNRYSMMARWHENLFPVCEELNVGYVAFSPLANGFLSDAFKKGENLSDGDFRNFMPQYSDKGHDDGARLLEYIRELSAKKNASPAQISLAWMMCKKPFIVPIPGSRKTERIEENAKAAEIVLTANEVTEIDDVLKKIKMPEVFGGHSAK